MSRQRDFDNIVHDWLELGPTELSDQVVETVRSTIGRTSQRRLWSSLRNAVPGGVGRRLSMAVGVAIVVVVVGVVGYDLTSRGIQAGSTASPPASGPASAASVRRLTFQALPVGDKTPDEAALAAIREIVAKRLVAAGIASPAVAVSGSDRIVVDLPAGADEAALSRLIGATGQLTFVPLPPDTYGSASTTGSPTGVVDGQPLPNDPALVPLFAGDQLASANPSTDQNGQPAVAFVLKIEAARTFADYTSANVGNFFAIVLDGTVISAPSINSAITGGDGQISIGSGPDSVSQMNELVALLRSSPLPFPLQTVATSP